MDADRLVEYRSKVTTLVNNQGWGHYDNCRDDCGVCISSTLLAEVDHLRKVITSIGQFLDRGDDTGVRLARQAVADLDRPEDT
jgi:hypothetical protein